MLAPPVVKPAPPDLVAPLGAPEAERAFYRSYAWCLNPHLTVREAVAHLRDELGRLAAVPGGWQRDEVANNVFLLACGLLNCVEEHLRGRTLRLPGRLAATRPGRGGAWLVERFANAPWSGAGLRGWRQRWLAALDDFLLTMLARGAQAPLAESARGLASALQQPLPPALQTQRLGIPSPFSRLDMTGQDVLALGRAFVRRFPERAQPLLLVGLRTSGSYFAPLLKAFLATEGYRSVALLTVEPTKGAGGWERRQLEAFAAQGYAAVLVDDPPHSGSTIHAALAILRRAGFAAEQSRILAPTHRAKRDWSKPFPEGLVVSLQPEQWHKPALLDPKAVEARLVDYFRDLGFAGARVVSSARAEEFNARLEEVRSDERSSRLKRVFEVEVEAGRGERTTRYVLAKSVGWGWFGYQAFLAAEALAEFVPPVLGLRDGILYMEWLPDAAPDRGDPQARSRLVDTVASYVAARVRSLSLKSDRSAALDLKRHNNGVRLVERAFSRAYGRLLTDTLMRSRLGAAMRQQHNAHPTLIDGNMLATEWVATPSGPRKTDYEHHGMGKAALNVTDPAYDLADAILNLSLSPAEESRLLRRYIDESGDATVAQRLFMNKLMAGIWGMNQAQEQLFGTARGAEMQQRCHQRFMRAWNFLTVETALHCGARDGARNAPEWRPPLILLDVDGVIDRRLFGFPATTAAGIEALALLDAHGFSVALNTARSVSEVKDYCRAYGLAGGVAEHGSYLWDAVRQRGQSMIGAEAERQLDTLRSNLRRIPGVFLDDRHEYSIRAFTYREQPHGLLASLLKARSASAIGDGALAPLPTLVVNQLITDLGLDRLSCHHTTIDTTIVAKEVDKGTGLTALRDWVLTPDAETVAVGDHDADLAMFRLATRCFAPANTTCARQVRLLGGRVAHKAYQQGLLEIARMVAHPDGRTCERCAHNGERSADDDLFMQVLRAADRPALTNFVRAAFDPAAFRIFVR